MYTSSMQAEKDSVESNWEEEIREDNAKPHTSDPADAGSDSLDRQMRSPALDEGSSFHKNMLHIGSSI